MAGPQAEEFVQAGAAGLGTAGPEASGEEAEHEEEEAAEKLQERLLSAQRVLNLSEPASKRRETQPRPVGVFTRRAQGHADGQQHQ